MTDALEQARAEAAAAVAAAEKAKQDAEAAIARAERLASEATVAVPEARGEPVAPAAPVAHGPLSPSAVDAVRAGYAFDGPALELGALVNGDPLADVPVRIPLGMLARHGLVAGATGTGKTKTLQVMAEQLSAAGVPVFAADVKGDLSGIATPGEPGEKLLERTRGIGQDWSPEGAPTEYFALGGLGTGVPVRATVSGFGSLLLAKVLGLNDTQESSLGLVFHYAEQAGLPLLDLADLRAVLTWLTSDWARASWTGWAVSAGRPSGSSSASSSRSPIRGPTRSSANPRSTRRSSSAPPPTAGASSASSSCPGSTTARPCSRRS
jgi:DNA helicase HerA-like ATPase